MTATHWSSSSKVKTKGARTIQEMCRGSEAGSYLRLIDFVYHSTLGLRVIKKKQSHSSFSSKVKTKGAGTIQESSRSCDRSDPEPVFRQEMIYNTTLLLSRQLEFLI